jgi:glycosyltransferase involved in cell wall biosynthesis
VLVVNPLIAAMVGPFAGKVHVVPSGFDPDRFPWPWNDPPRWPDNRVRVFFAGLVDEYMKGFHILREACDRLWRKRQDFELVVTGNRPSGTGLQPSESQQADSFTRYIGWLSQDELPRALRQADLLVFPTIAEEALGRSAVEAMGVGRPVIASRIGGLPFTVADGATGLLFEPGNVDDLTFKIETMLDDSELRERMGRAGRKRFEEHFTWDAVINRHYHALFQTARECHASP